MAENIFTTLFRWSPRLKGILWRQAYQFLAKYYQKKDWAFINYGYAPLSDPGHALHAVALDPADEAERLCIQLYHHLASSIDLSGLRVLEVGCGRGGGADYIMRYFKPESMVGIDFSKYAVALCNRTYALSGLVFKFGDAESLPFGDGSFHAVVNVESSHCYVSVEAFLREVKRVLCKGGYLLFADFRDREYIHTLREQLRGSGLTLIREMNITANVLAAMDQDDRRKTILIETKLREALGLDEPLQGRMDLKLRWLKNKIYVSLADWIGEFSGVRGSRIYNQFQEGDALYVSFILQKQAP